MQTNVTSERKEVDMSGAKAKTATIQKGNPILPSPPIPKKVLVSNTKLPSTQDGKEEQQETKPTTIEKEGVSKEDGKASGVITIYVFRDRPYEAKFTGEITGVELNIAWRAMYKQYKLWKHKLLKEGGK